MTLERPILIDEQDGACEICAAHEDGKCDLCHGEFNSHLAQEMGNSGYQTPTAHHYHIRKIEGVQGREAIRLEVCLPCYRQAFQAVYPDAEVPV